jgi:lambda repressor-like predicted transcriptional regulator
MKLHQGEIIEKLIRRNGVSISELARRMRVNRRSVYNWFNQSTLKLDAIIKIGNIVGCDIPKEYPDAFTNEDFAMLDGMKTYQPNPQTDTTNNTQFWINKYVTLLEEYNQLLMRQSNQLQKLESEVPAKKNGMTNNLNYANQ